MFREYTGRIGVRREERRQGEKYARRYGLSDAKIKITKLTSHTFLYLIGYDDREVKYKIRFDKVMSMSPPTNRQVDDEYKVKDFVLRAIEIHGEKYDYSMVEYKHVKGSHIKIPIICNTGEHGVFWQTKSNHIMCVRGCPKCGNKRRGRWKNHSKKQ